MKYTLNNRQKTFVLLLYKDLDPKSLRQKWTITDYPANESGDKEECPFTLFVNDKFIDDISEDLFNEIKAVSRLKCTMTNEQRERMVGIIKNYNNLFEVLDAFAEIHPRVLKRLLKQEAKALGIDDFKDTEEWWTQAIYDETADDLLLNVKLAIADYCRTR